MRENTSRAFPTGSYTFLIEPGHKVRIQVEIYGSSQLFILEGVTKQKIKFGKRWPQSYEYIVESKGVKDHIVCFLRGSQKK